MKRIVYIWLSISCSYCACDLLVDAIQYTGRFVELKGLYCLCGFRFVFFLS